MVGWRPLATEPDVLKGALLDYLRDRAGLVYTEPSAGPKNLGRATVIIADGRKLAIELAMRPERQAAWAGRATLVFGISGQAADSRFGYGVEGEAVIDVETRCFMALDINVSSFEHAKPS